MSEQSNKAKLKGVASPASRFQANMQIWDTNVVRKAARGEFDLQKLKTHCSVGISPVIFLELCTKLDEAFDEKKKAAKIALDYGTHFLPDPTTYLRFIWGMIDETEALRQAEKFRYYLQRLSDPKLSLADAQREFSGQQAERERAYRTWVEDIEISRQNIVTDIEFIKRRDKLSAKTSLGKDEIVRVQKLMGTSFVTWTIIEATLDRITQDVELSKQILTQMPASQLKDTWMSVQVYVDIYRSYFENLLISGEAIDPNDKGDSELLFYLCGLRLLFRDVEPVLATFEEKWQRFAEAAGWGDWVWKLSP